MFAPQTVYTSGPAGYNSSGAPVDVVLTAHATLATGDIVVLPTPSFNTTDGNCYWATTAQTAQPATANFAGTTRRLFGVVVTGGATGATVKIRIRGVALVTIPTGINANALLQPTNASFVAQAAAGQATNAVCVAIALEANSSGSNAAKACMFDGLYGLSMAGA